jgi:hypothetical protein
MPRLIHMSRFVWVGTVLAALLSGGCTSSSHLKAGCMQDYPTAIATKSAVAGDLRFFGPRPLNGTGNFAELSDNAGVSLCLVPDGKGQYAVYGVPESTGHGQRLWTQSSPQGFFPPL